VIDSHCHLDSDRFHEDREAVIERALAAGVTRMLTIGTGDGPPDLECAIRLAEAHEAVYATAGVHPHDASKADAGTLPALRELMKHSKVLALGEIGLDYHYDFSPRGVQQRVFIEQMEIAAEARKPIVIHTREAWDDTFGLIERHFKPAGLGGVMHCFSGGPAEAERALKLGFHLSFGGIVTFPNARSVQQAAQLCPEDRLLIETDAPFLAPVPHRGKRNEPAFVAHTAARLAALRGVTLEEIAAATTRNFLAWARVHVS
jgi:TatD DNase family protein